MSHPDAVKRVVDLWNKSGGWIPGANYKLLAEALGVDPAVLRHYDTSQPVGERQVAAVPYRGVMGVTAAELLQSPDVTSSASRQHWIETGEYLTLGDRPELSLEGFQIAVETRHGRGLLGEFFAEQDNEDDFTNPNGV